MRRGTGRTRDGPIVACATRAGRPIPAGRPIEGAGPGTAGAGIPATSMLEGIQVRVAWGLRIPGREVSITGVEVGFPSWAGALQRKYGALAVIERPPRPLAPSVTLSSAHRGLWITPAQLRITGPRGSAIFLPREGAEAIPGLDG